jgi:hypothetical protein
MRKVLFGFAIGVLLTACGAEGPPPRVPEAEAAKTAEQPATPPPAATAEANAKVEASSPAPSSAVKLDIKAGAFTPAKTAKTVSAFEVKADGSVQLGGAPIYKINGDRIEDLKGSLIANVGADGAVTGPAWKLGYKFLGDALVHDDGSKVAVAADGTMSATFAKKTEIWGQVDKSAPKKTMTLLAFVFFGPRG